ncbi:CvpA family protein [Ruminiclostridium herbifermentans]|uniref:CvpA family protein n=1 Tax=Ruminiclostridium herbifermentans TaxID=2488810 RepID=A0A4U7JFV7_9FIRM|nr:CvpA family protein [Ruminiclostridium herbifermentans]QNU66592.1 CvpA family protein [Ruminiclostridium herbifermentans]
MNWTDIAVFAIIAAFMVYGLKNGFLYSVFRLISYVMSVIFAIKFYPIISNILQKTVLYENIKKAVIDGITKRQMGNSTVPNEDSAQAIIDGLKLPGFIKDSINEKVLGQDIFGFQKIIDAIGSEIAMLVVNILSVILIYLIIRFALIFIRVIIKTISKLPVFKQLDKTGGIVLGAIEGILVVYVLCAVLILFSAFPKFEPTIESIEDSKFANYFYQNNFIVSWISPEEELNLSSPDVAKSN